MITYCVISVVSFRLQMLMFGKSGSADAFLVGFAFTKSVIINATKYVDIFGVISNSSRMYPGECGLVEATAMAQGEGKRGIDISHKTHEKFTVAFNKLIDERNINSLGVFARHIRQSHCTVFFTNHGNLELCLLIRPIETWECSSCVNWGKLRAYQPSTPNKE